MKLLILYIGENEKFDKNLLVEIMAHIPGTKALGEENLVGSIREWEFVDKGDCAARTRLRDRTLVRLSEYLETISIPGTGDASLKIALEIQKLYPIPIRVVDEDYSFDLVLKEMGSVTALRQKMLALSSEQYVLLS